MKPWPLLNGISQKSALVSMVLSDLISYKCVINYFAKEQRKCRVNIPLKDVMSPPSG